MNSTEKIYSSFPSFIERIILPLYLQNSNHIRLDGQSSKGNRDVAGRFKYKEQIWKVHMDTHYEPLFLAHYSWKYKTGERTFVEEKTNSGTKLSLTNEINSFRNSRFSYLYIYLD